MIHSSYFKPKVIPVLNNVAMANIDRVQELTATTTLNRTKVEEVGRVGTVCWRKNNPTVSVSLRQLEYGALAFYRKLACKSDATTKIELTDFKTSTMDVAAYSTDDNGTFLSTVWYPNLRCAGFSLNIANPEALIERNFSLVGEDDITLKQNNKYLIQLTHTAASGGDNTIEIGLSGGDWATYPAPVEDQDNSGKYFLRAYEVDGTTNTELVEGTDFTYDTGTTTITITSVTSGAHYIFMYSAATYISGVDPFTLNDSDLCSIPADSVSMFIGTADQLYKLQSVGVDVSFDRFDVKEIGNQDIVTRGVRDTNVRVNLGRMLEDYTIDNVLRGESSTYGKIDVRELGTDVDLIIKIYEDHTKTTFKMGYKFTALSTASIEEGANLNDYVNRNITLEGEAGFVTSVEADLTA